MINRGNDSIQIYQGQPIAQFILEKIMSSSINVIENVINDMNKLRPVHPKWNIKGNDE